MHKIPPFWQSALNSSLDFFKGQTESRYTLCQKACQLLLLEFFADEEGHIVVKIPNWILSSNFLRMNNCNIRYYDDVRYTDLPQFKINDDGSIEAQASSNNGGDSDSDSGGLSGWLNKIFSGISKALDSVFGTLLTGKDNEDRVVAEPVGEANNTNPTYDFPYMKDIFTRTASRVTKSPVGKIQDFFTGITNKIFGSEDNTEQVDYTYAGLTNDIINDILDKNNNTVVQIDEYKFKLQVKDIHDEKFGSLYSIAKYCYGNIYKWHIIAELNNIYEPTEIHEGQWLELYSNEPISDFIINSSSIDNLEIQELKYLRKLQLQQLYKTNANEITVSNCPFIKGEFISYPKQIRHKRKKINFTNNITTKLPNKKKFFISTNKIHSNELSKKIIHCNEETINKISKASAYINNGYILSDYHEEYDNATGKWKIVLTIPNTIDETEDENNDKYILSEYESDATYEVILTIEEEKDITDENKNKYILSEYEENKNGNNTEIILTILDKKSTDTKPDDKPIIEPTPIEYVENDIDHSSKTKKIKNKEMPKPIHDKTTPTDIDDTDDSTDITHNLPEESQDDDGKVTDNTGPDKDFERRVSRAAKERSSHARTIAQRVQTYNESTKLAQAEDVTQDDSEEAAKKRKTQFRSQRTDMDIPVIPNEYIISFTLTDSDQEVYNYIEIGGSLAFGMMQGESGNIASIFKNIPDYDHIMHFGLRPHPVIQCSPLVNSVEQACILGSLLLYRSQLNRYSGVLTCIEDSAIKVGNPIRVYLYDEHPYPLMRRFGSKETMTEEELRAAAPYFDEKYYKEQAVFYVESISRNIDVQNVSTMTLQLKNGRVMGMTNPADILECMYESYYEDYQSRNYYEKRGGNDTALVALHSTDLSKEQAAHEAARAEANSGYDTNTEKYERYKRWQELDDWYDKAKSDAEAAKKK